MTAPGMPSYPTGSPPNDLEPWDDSHRPWPVPKRPWVGFMTWLDLLFAHWPIKPQALRERVPQALELDTFDGSAWIGIVPFVMSNVRPRFSPVAVTDFPELNVRTYVTYRGKPGVYFFSLDAASSLLVWGGRTFASLPYYNAAMRAAVDERGWTRYASRRTHGGAAPAQWIARYRSTGRAAPPKPGTLEHFLTERYCFYSVARTGHVLRCDIHHVPWPLEPAELETKTDTMLKQIKLARPDVPPLLHFARRRDVRVWWPVPVAGDG
ncbi:MAG TPA: DUF2071 domain-containing protein [Tepidisphaeraceae bacterium]|nr:DUF2071 domain-containing protein [Tepidisphaeraceae bacterium]